MKIASVIIDQKSGKEMILFVNKEEAQIIFNAVSLYAEQNKRKKKVKDLCKQLDSDLECW